MADHSKMNADSGGFMENFKAGKCLSIIFEFLGIFLKKRKPKALEYLCGGQFVICN